MVTTPYICISEESSTIEYDFINSISRSYNIIGYPTRFEAENALIINAACPVVDLQYSSMVRKTITVTGVEGFDDEWVGSATWENYEPPSITTEVLSGSTAVTGSNVKISFRHVGSYGPGGSTPNFSGYINQTVEGGVEGANWDIASTSFTLKKYYAKGTYSLAWMANAAAYVGLPNTVPWRGFGTGTLKIVGIDGSSNSGEYDEISYRFAALPTYENVVIPSPLGNIVVPEVLGWQLLHTSSKYIYDGNGDKYLVPYAAHVDELSPGVDINGLIP